MLIIPSTAVMSKFLKTLPINSIYVDPINSHKYIVEEKEHNGTLLKVANPYLGPEDGITINPPNELIKSQNVTRSNPMTRMKERISFLENQVKELLEKESSPTMSMYSHLNNMVGKDKYKEFDNDLFKLDNGVIFHLTKDRTKGDCEQCLDELISFCWKDADKLASVMKRQHKIQKKLLAHLTSISK